MDDHEVIRIKMVQHNIGRKQTKNNQIIHKDALRPFFRRTVKNYLDAQLERTNADVYTLQEASLETNIELTPHVESLLRKNTSAVQYSPACKGIYVWFTPAYEHEAPTFVFLSEPFRVHSRNFQYMYAKTAVGLQYKTSGADEARNNAYHHHGVAVAYDLDVFSLQERTKRNKRERSVYNLLYDNIRTEKLASLRKNAKIITSIDGYRIPKVRYSPVVVLRHLASNYTFGFISMHGKIVNLRQGNAYLDPADIRNELSFYHDTDRIRRQLHKEYPVFLGVDLNVDLCNIVRYFDHYNRHDQSTAGHAKAKRAFLQHFSLYGKVLKQNDIAVHPPPQRKPCLHTETNPRHFRTLIDYIMFHQGSMIKYSDVKIKREAPGQSGNALLVNDFDHIPLVMHFHAPVNRESFSSLDKSAQERHAAQNSTPKERRRRDPTRRRRDPTRRRRGPTRRATRRATRRRRGPTRRRRGPTRRATRRRA